MTRTPEQIATEISNWNLRDVSDLRDMIAELSNCRDDMGEKIDVEAFVDMTSLPSVEFPEDIDTGYPVWAIDRSGNALVGANADEVETLEEIRAA